MSQEKYATARKMMADLLEHLINTVVALRDREVGKFHSSQISAVAHGSQPIIRCALMSQDMLKLLSGDKPFEDIHELFIALEHGSTSIVNLVLILAAY